MTNYNESEHSGIKGDAESLSVSQSQGLPSKDPLTAGVSLNAEAEDTVNAAFMRGLKADDVFAAKTGVTGTGLSEKKEPNINLGDGQYMSSSNQVREVASENKDAVPKALQKSNLSHDDLTSNSDKEESRLDHEPELQTFLGDAGSLDKDQKEESLVKAAADSHDSFEHKEDDASSQVDDPDKVPIVPTLRDDEVPNLPGAILMHARELLGLSQRDVANRLLLRVNTISDIEHDRLNQPTAEHFVAAHIANYAKLVNIDPEVLVSLYRQNVRKNVQEGALHFEEHARQGRLGLKKSRLKLVLVLIVITIIACIAYWFLLGSADNQDAESSRTGSLQLEGQQSFKEDAGEIKLEGNPFAAGSNQGNATPRVDPNTAKAREQTLALNTNELITDPGQSGDFAADHDSLSDNVTVELKTSSGPGVSKKHQDKTRSENSAANLPTRESASPSLRAVDLKRAEVKRNQSLAVPLDKTLSVPREESGSSKVLTQDQAQKVANDNDSTAKVKLSGNLKDISRNAKLSGKQGLESMNNATVRVFGNVALKITDSRGQVLSQGAFKSGDVVKAIGIPPIRISVSDSSKIKVSYMGGTVSVPDSKQVSFALPQR